MNTTATWHSDGVRWIASVLVDLADFMDRTDSAPGGKAYVCPGDVIDETRARLERYY